MSDEWKPVIRQLPNAPTTPDVVLGRTLSKRMRIKAVACIILWDDDTAAVDWSSMRIKDLCFLEACFRQKVDDVMRGVEEETGAQPPAPAA